MMSASSVFSEITERIKPEKLTTKKFYTKVIYELNCNWKVYVDNYLEGYHLPHVHPGLSRLLNYKQYTTETFEFHSLQYSPFNNVDNPYSGSENGEAFYYFIFPNFMLNIVPGRLQTNHILPVSENKTKVIFDYYYDDIESEKAIKQINEDLQYSDEIQKEDINICQLVQKGLESGAYYKGRISVKRETGVYHYHNMLRKFYNLNEK